MTSLRVLSQTDGSTSNVDSAQTSQTNLTFSEASTSRRGSPVWPTKLELRGSYYEDSMFGNNSCGDVLLGGSGVNFAAYSSDHASPSSEETESVPSHPATSFSSSVGSSPSEVSGGTVNQVGEFRRTQEL